MLRSYLKLQNCVHFNLNFFKTEESFYRYWEFSLIFTSIFNDIYCNNCLAWATT